LRASPHNTAGTGAGERVRSSSSTPASARWKAFANVVCNGGGLFGFVPETYVFKQDPQPGEHIDKGNYVTIFSSLGPPKTDVPSVVGEPYSQALSDLHDANLKAKIARVDNDAPQDQVIAQNPKAGAKVE